MQHYLTQILFLTLSLFVNLVAWGAELRVEEGHIDLNSFPFDDFETHSLAGDWEFYWQQLLEPEDFTTGSQPPKKLITVPGSWSIVDHYPDAGYGTYRAVISLSESRQVSLQFQAIWSASRVFIDGELIFEQGVVATGDNPSIYKPHVSNQVYTFTPKDKEFEIVIQAVNYETFLAGLATSSPFIGSADAIRNRIIIHSAESVFVIGCIFIMGIYHLVLWSIRTKEKSTLNFGLFCITVAIYMCFTSGGSLVTHIFLPTGFSWNTRLYNIWVLAPVFFFWFTKDIFPNYISINYAKFKTLLAVTFFIYILFNEPSDFIWTAPILQGETLISFVYIYFSLYKIIRNKEEGSYIFLAGMLVISTAVVNDMLITLGIIDSLPMGGLGTLIFVFIQSFFLARRFSNAFSTVEKSSRRIQKLSDDLRIERDNVVELNENLEAMVAEKTKDIRAIMGHIELGIFTIVKNGRINKDFSPHLKYLFEKQNLEGEDGLEILFSNTDLSNDEIDQSINAIACSIGEDKLAWDINNHCLPREFKRQLKNGSWRIIEVTWNPIVANNIVERLLLTIRDITKLRELAAEANDKQEELELIGELLNIHHEDFRRFTQTCQYFIAENRKLINSKSMKAKDLEVLKVLFINMHTMKGTARSLYFKKMTLVFHEVEHYYSELQKNPEKLWDIEKMNRDIDEAEKIVHRYINLSVNKLGRKLSDQKSVMLSQDMALTIYNQLKEEDHKNKDTRRILKHLHRLIYTSLRSIIDDSCMNLATLARDLKKEQPLVSFHGKDLYMSAKGDELLRRILIHMLRNSMDHGIEFPKERHEKGKDKRGLISISVVARRDHFEMHFSDDGRGLDLRKISETAVRNHIIDPHQTLSIDETAKLIFSNGLSTATSISDVSGRGVGMDAIRSYLEEVDASISISLGERSSENTDFINFAFLIKLPKHLFAETVKDLDAA